MYNAIGKFNEIHTTDIGDKTIFGNFNYIAAKKIGRNNKFHNHINVYPGSVFGDDNIINVYCVFNNNTKVGSRNIFGGNVMTADEKNMSPYTDRLKRKPCIIGDGNKIGQGAMLISIKIGNNNVIGAGAVCLKDIGDNEVWVGVPAKKIRNTTQAEINLSKP